MRTRQIRVKGRVQGVGFRDALRVEALRLGVRGWVRNRADGSVQALLQGDDDAVEHLVQWARHGPPLAQVRTMDEETIEQVLERSYDDFERWPTT